MAKKLIITAVGVTLLLASCDVKDPIYEGSQTDHPDHGKITLTADWSGMGAGITKPAGYDISVAGYSCRLAGDCNTIDNLFDPGTYTGLAWNEADKVTVSSSTASVATASGYLDAQPGWFFTARDNNVVIEKDKHHQYIAAMQQQVRQLTLIVEPTGGTADKISSIEATLSGAAGTLNFDSDTHGTPSNVALAFTKITSGGDTGKWTATVRLLGVAGAQQKLTGTIKFTGGNPADMPLESDLSAALANFNTDKKTPLTLGGTIAETPTGAGFSATINGWTKETGSGIAN